jgi:hypothetical protein
MKRRTTRLISLPLLLMALILTVIPVISAGAAIPDYQFTTIDYTATLGGTGPWGINPKGDIVGFYYPPDSATALGFSVIKGQFASVDQGINTTVISINPSGEMVGDFQPNLAEAWHWHGFRITRQGDAIPIIDPNNHESIVPMRVLPDGTIVGFVQSTVDNTTKHGMVMHPDGSVDYYEDLLNSRHNGATPDAMIITGWYTDGQAGANHGYVLDNGNLTTFDVPSIPGSLTLSTMPTDIKSDGSIIVGVYVQLVFGVGVKVHGFAAERFGTSVNDWKFKTIDYPDAITTGIGGINANGDLVGNYVSADGFRHGYIATHANNYK